MVLLTGCAKESIRYDTKESTKALLPQIVEYSRAKQVTGAKEIESNLCPVLTDFTQDGSKLRDQIRLIKQELK